MAISFFAIHWIPGENDPGVNVVRGVPPISEALSQVAQAADRMATLPVGERGAYLEQHHPHLKTDLLYYLRDMEKLSSAQEVTRVEFRYGSLQDVAAESGDGETRHGFFEDQIIALVYIQGAEFPITVIVECLNGIFTLPEQLRGLQLVGDHAPRERFTIGPREGLTHHVSYATAIDLATRFNLPLYRGRNLGAQNRITPTEARALESQTDRVQVTVRVFEGDVFDLRRMQFIPAPRRPST